VQVRWDCDWLRRLVRWRRDVKHQRDFVNDGARELPNVWCEVVRILRWMSAKAEQEDAPEQLYGVSQTVESA
jgi:hypothetical protein